MKVTFKAKTQDEITILSKAWKYYFALNDIKNMLRTKVKYDDLPEERFKEADEIYTKFYEILEEHDVLLDEIT